MMSPSVTILSSDNEEAAQPTDGKGVRKYFRNYSQIVKHG